MEANKEFQATAENASSTCEESNKASNPIIFARTKTVHIPKTLIQQQSHEKLADAVYSVDDNGSLKHTPMPLIREEEEDEPAPQNISSFKFFLKAFWNLFCNCNDEITNSENSIKEPLVGATDTSQQEEEEEIPLGPFLQPQSEVNKGRKTLVLDLDETLVHSTFQKVSDSDYIIPVEIEGNIYSVYVYLRPGALEFIKKMSEIYEVIIYTASLSIYADPLLDRMDENQYISARLFRDHCTMSEGVYVKDLGLLGRDLKEVIMIDNAATSFKFQPTNGIECTAFIDDKSDYELLSMIPFLEYVARKDDVRNYLKMWNESSVEARNNLVNLM